MGGAWVWKILHDNVRVHFVVLDVREATPGSMSDSLLSGWVGYSGVVDMCIELRWL